MINSLKFAENINWRKGWECRFGLEVALAGPENPNGNRSLEGPTWEASSTIPSLGGAYLDVQLEKEYVPEETIPRSKSLASFPIVFSWYSR